MEPDAVNVDEPTLGRVPPRHPAGLVDVENGRRRQCRGSNAEDHA
jgi:hypothetical protein